MVKVRRSRSVDCVVGGYVPDASGLPAAPVLGLYDRCGILHHVGNTSVLPAGQRTDAAKILHRHLGQPSFGDGRMPGYGRWPGQRHLVWLPVAPQVVCEVTSGNIDHGRFRHSLRFHRWRPDRDGRSCRTAQLRNMFDRLVAIRRIRSGCYACEACRGGLSDPALSQGGWGFCRVCRCAWQISAPDGHEYAATIPSDMHRPPTRVPKPQPADDRRH